MILIRIQLFDGFNGQVVAFTPMATDNIYSAYQPYSVSPQHTVAHLKEQTPFEEAATIPLAGLTAAIGTFLRLQLPEPDAQGNPAPGAEKTTVLIWGASSSVGSFAVQLAKRAGFFV